ncbi:polynucleotide 5'-hydroxyl-kinase NOL9 [Drosophila takahashii]|uniref:polynucleotide 5'-hydroxyl-kinase NOL9 n=1 Tax=Drosophila takahashii TaxID=29030 RepID=UPI003898FB8B
MLSPQMLKEMKLSFQLTEQRELASGRRRPEKQVTPPVASKQKGIPKASSAPAEISPPKIQKLEMETPQTSKAKKKAAKKRLLSNKESIPGSSPIEKRPKKDVGSPLEISKIIPTKPIALKSNDSVSKNHKKGSQQKAFKKNESAKSAPIKTKGSKAAKLQSKPKKSKESSKNGYTNSNKLAQNGPVKSSKASTVNGIDKGENSVVIVNNLISRDSEEVSDTFFKKPHIFKVKSKGNQSKILDFPAPFENVESRAHLLQGNSKGIVRKIEVFENAYANIDSDELDDDYEPQYDEDFSSEDFTSDEFESEDASSDGFDDGEGTIQMMEVFQNSQEDSDELDDDYEPRDGEVLSSEDFDSSESDSEDLDDEDSEDFDNDDDDEDFDSEDSDSEEFASDFFDSDDLDSTYEPPDIDGFFDDPPLGIQKEPLIIEEIFDEKTEDENQKELVRYKPKAKETIKEACVVEEIAEESVIVTPKIDTIKAATSPPPEEPEDIEENAEESLPEVVTTEKEQLSQPIDAPFYRNPQANFTELSVFENSLKSNHVLAVIKEDLELYGTLVLTLLSGQISVNGYRPRRQEALNIYSPKGLNWVSISPTKVKKPAKDAVDWEELNKNFTRAQLDRIQGSFQSQTNAIVLLQRNTAGQRLVDNFGKHMAQNVFPLVNASNRPYHQSESLLHCLIQSSDLSRTLQVPQVWNKLKMQATSRILIAGGKGVGKSSLLRYLINRNLGQFPSLLLIDLDIGQPEIFVPQTVSCTLIDGPLLGPGFLFNKQPDYAYVVGHTNIVLCAEQYARAVIQLIQDVQKDEKYANIPWLINTMGYNKGFGSELMALLVDRIHPTDLVQIASPFPINNFDSALDSSSLSQLKPIIYTADEFRVKEIPKYTLHKLLSAVPAKEPGTWSLSAKDMRYSNLLARLSSCLTGNAKSLTDCQPLKVSLDSLKIVHATSENYSREELIRGMEANVVYLCHQGAGLPQCLGIGVVRAIDYDRKELFLVPAMPLQRMSLVDCLILGGQLTLPQGYFRDQGQGVASSVPFVFILDDSKSSKSIQQIYHRSPAFLGVPASQRN